MTSKIPYLHPSLRILKSEQVGLSSHKNYYSDNRVLEGNWVEERMAKENLLKSTKPKFDSISETMDKYRDPKSYKEYPNIGSELMTTTELDRDILFAHGNNPQNRSLLSMNDIVYLKPEFDRSIKTEKGLQLIGHEIPPRRDLISKMREKWNEEIEMETKQEELFKTVYKTEIAKW